MRALGYFFSEAVESLWRTRRAALLSILTIAGGLFVLGFFIALNTNLQRIVQRWTATAELSVYLKDTVAKDELTSVDELIAKSGMIEPRVGWAAETPWNVSHTRIPARRASSSGRAALPKRATSPCRAARRAFR